MATYGDMQARIAGEMMGAPVSSAQIQAAILSAVAEYEEDRFFFNVLRSGDSTVLDSAGSVVLDSAGALVFDGGGFLTQPGGEFYPVSLWAMDAYTAHVDTVTIVAFDSRFTLRPQTAQWMEDNSVGLSWRSLPTDWTYVSESIRLYPIPDAVYPVIITGTQIFAPLFATSDSSPWTNDAEEMIRCAAKKRLYRHVDRNEDMAMSMEKDEARLLSKLRGKTAGRGPPLRARIRSWW